MDSKLVCTEFESPMTEDSFWKSVNILISKPHVVNKRLWGNKILHRSLCKNFPNRNIQWKCERLKSENIAKCEKYLFQQLKLEEFKEKMDSACTGEVILIELLPKIFHENHAYQLMILMKENGLVNFFDVTPADINQKLIPNFFYSFQFIKDKILVKAECDVTSKSYQWLKKSVLPQLVKWGSENNKIGSQSICTESLALVSNDEYYKKYNELKLKYGKEMVKIWPECTDPSKFVYEDVAIATYLLVLWEQEKLHLNLTTPQTFVDLGCGNGLLVYILAKEGHKGVGIDVRKRHIWGTYPDEVILQEKTITPSDVNLFPNTDWIIGNHSDELTPWIPVIAARSSYKCNFFLLPCCAFNFDGTKYQRQNSSKSQYTEYLSYIKQLCENCGLKTDVDRLKIPSTKRICLIGRGRNYPEDEHEKYCNSIQDIINLETHSVLSNNDKQSSWIHDFKPRDPVERVRNCTQIDKTLIDSIVEVISNYLLQGCNLDNSWSAGKEVDINEVVQLIDQDKLNALKSECGGLQTLLKNNHHIFKVESGKVQLRHPKTIAEVCKDRNNKSNRNKGKTTTTKIQQRPCWFYSNHPQGCPLKDSDCSFLHSTS